jgi:hypothetical protein
MKMFQNAPEGWERLRTTLPDGKWVSTVHLGINVQFGDGPALWYETMVFPGPDQWSELDCDRYSTPEEAREGHARMVAKWSEGQP